MATVAARETKEAPLIEPEGRNSLERTADLTRRLLAVPKAEADAEMRKFKRRRKRRK